jgi:two-component system cell cycle response regulator DivK
MESPMKKKILIVEDNRDSLEILTLFINRIGCQTLKAKNSKEAIELTETERPDLIFMDMELPDADGIKTAKVLKQNPRTCQIPIVAVTAWISDLWREKAAQAGIVDYLIKPVAPQTLKEAIERYAKGPLTPHAARSEI